MELSRRNFLTGLGVAGAGAALAGLTACSPSGKSSDSSKESTVATEEESYNPTETIETDLLIVGAGMSGLAAAVQAGLNGDKTLVLEAQSAAGGAGNGVEGIFACGSSMQKAAGIEFSKSEILKDETSLTNYTNDGLMWKKTLENSAANIDWLLEQGAEIEKVDDYAGVCKYPGFHWWKGGHAKYGYVQQMLTRATGLGVEFKYDTQAKKLIYENGVVKGLYAIDKDDKCIQVNAKAVILAAGGFIGNVDLLKQQMNITEDEMAEACLTTAETLHRMGDGIKMATEVGARPHPQSCMEAWFQPAGMPVGDAAMTFDCMFTDKYGFREVFMFSGMASGGPVVWVQEDAQRYTDESAALKEIERTFSTGKYYKKRFQVYDQTYVDALYGKDEDLMKAYDAAVEQYDTIYKADTIEELAKKAGLDPEALAETINTYNDYCASGLDEDFAKDPSCLVPIATAPFYCFKAEICGDATLGGIVVNTNFQALDWEKNPITGLYMAGVDGCMLYSNVYPISIGGTACCNSVNSGRTSANHAHGYMATV